MSEAALERLRSWGADTAVVLGSGLSSLTEGVDAEQRISYPEFGDLPAPSVAGHTGQFVLGTIGETHVLFAQGRVHLYEGHSASAVTAGIRILSAAGIKRVILTNAAGSVNPEFEPGSWMQIRDHLNLTGTTPLLGRPEFLDMTDTYSAAWRERFAQAAQAAHVELRAGVYAGLLGPQYETPAEVRMLRTLGADAVGMSTVLEAVQARALGMEVAGFSCLTNWAAGISDAPLSHEEVLTTGKAAALDFARILREAFGN